MERNFFIPSLVLVIFFLVQVSGEGFHFVADRGVSDYFTASVIRKNVKSRQLSNDELVWKYRIDRALKQKKCLSVPEFTYSDGYYTGELIDSHFHTESLPDSGPGEEVGEVAYLQSIGKKVKGRGERRDKRSASKQRPVPGQNMVMGDIVCLFQQTNVKKAITYFPVYPDIYRRALDLVSRTLKQYPDTFYPFIMPPDNDGSPDGSPTVSTTVLKKMLGVYPRLFQGYGEIGLYERKGGSRELSPDSKRLNDIYPVLQKNRLVVYFHLAVGHADDLSRAASKYPDINFIFHGDQLSIPEIEGLLSEHTNIFYTIDELYGDVFLLSSQRSKEEFLAHFRNIEPLLQKDIATWKGVIDRHPDQFMWGTDRGAEILWSLDLEVGKTITDYGRAFIGRLSPEVQENYAYRNAERVMGEGWGNDE